MSYRAIVCKVSSTEPIPGRDKIHLSKMLGYQIITSTSVIPGDTLILMEADGQLSTDFAQANDLIERHAPDGTKLNSGYFEPNRRVKAMKMAGVRSDGFACSSDLFAYTGFDLSLLVEGFEFDELNGHPICNKYVTPSTRRAARQGQPGTQKKQNLMFRQHIDTPNIKRAIQNIPNDSILYISEKCDGTSLRYGNVLNEVVTKRTTLDQLYYDLYHRISQIKHVGKIWKKYAKYPKPQPTKMEWTHLNGTRKTILGQSRYEVAIHEHEPFREKVVKGLELQKGEIIYGEIVGYEYPGKAVQRRRTKDKALIKRYGEYVDFSYGFNDGECGLFVYRITMTNEDGFVVELTWPQLVKRCADLGLTHVPHMNTWHFDRDFRNDHNALLKCMIDKVDGPDGNQTFNSSLDNRHMLEGYVVRYESPQGVTGWLKVKASSFVGIEQTSKDDANYLDIEESQLDSEEEGPSPCDSIGVADVGEEQEVE